MSVQFRNNVHIAGTGHGDHGVCPWLRLRPDNVALSGAGIRRTASVPITFDLVGSGGSDLSAYDRAKYGSLHGYADDLLEILDEFAPGPVVFVGHSVSTMIGLLATIKAPERFVAQVMVGPSPCYINDGDYVGGFSREDIDELLDSQA
jgi:sigma-B regulation protein RsbQ